ncbi:MAG: metalloregulator ArsR/SmtB family transcription factor [Myxococcota bacterium]|nr:metalloregulator ArsR/SmtB family transcription factor [Myxococcota bacterium]
MIDNNENAGAAEHSTDCEHEVTPFAGREDRIIEKAAALLRAAGEPERLRLLERLGHAEACVGELSEELGWGMPTISQRLKVLHQEGLISRRREGKHIYYALDDDHVRDLIINVFEHVSELR